MTNKVDLTEHNDFRDRDNINRNAVSDFINNEFVTPEELDAINEYENIFGRRHHTVRFELFGYGKSDYEGHCYRCGKELRIPWLIFFDLCNESNHLFEPKFPWNTPNSQNSIDNSLFDLR